MTLTAGTRFGSHDSVVLVAAAASARSIARDTNLRARWRDVAIKGARSWPRSTLASRSWRPAPDELGPVERIAGQIDLSDAAVFRIACSETGWHLRSTPVGAPRAYGARWRSGSN